jgi:hypothetical protein
MKEKTFYVNGIEPNVTDDSISSNIEEGFCKPPIIKYDFLWGLDSY